MGKVWFFDFLGLFIYIYIYYREREREYATVFVLVNGHGSRGNLGVVIFTTRVFAARCSAQKLEGEAKTTQGGEE